MMCNVMLRFFQVYSTVPKVTTVIFELIVSYLKRLPDVGPIHLINVGMCLICRDLNRVNVVRYNVYCITTEKI